ncbi:DUF4194 domain-containing protein [Paenibacillus silviterrae]|uniref:DUF4194 domain-containing protein n=1 Tax=Paenibacillus silviterrae TaxID=3242194 RepID=UPI002543C8D8|nr:DUF4194 domain-containing protein [Paenibacillus chinjuensis]
MEWFERYQAMSDKEKDQFSRIAATMLQQTFLLREKMDLRERTVEINRDFRFVEYYQDVFRGYLAMSGWQFDLDVTYGVCSVSHGSGMNRASLGKWATYLLYVLRLIYEEEREKLSLRKDVVTTLGAVHDKLFMFQLAERKLPDVIWNEALSTLKQYQLIDKLDGSRIEPESRLVIYPSILFLVGPEHIGRLEKRLQEEQGSSEEVSA